jgi:phenylacetyl-CoA:acceptor oxidoreductase
VPLKGAGWDFSLDPARSYGRDEIWDAVCRAASADVSDGKQTHGLDWWKENGLATKPFAHADWYLFPTLVAQGLRFEMPYQERLYRIGKELGNRLHEHDMHWWDQQLAEYQGLPLWKDFPGVWEQSLINMGGKAKDFPFWLLTSRSMQYSWGANVGIQLMKEVGDNLHGHRGVIINARTAAGLGVAEGDTVEIATPKHSVKAKAVLRQGIRPDTLLLMAQFDHWATPFAKDFGVPSMNSLVPMSMELTDATGSGADIVRVNLKRARGET